MKDTFILIQRLIDSVGLFNNISIDIHTNEHEHAIEVLPEMHIYYLYEDGLEERLDEFLGAEYKEDNDDYIYYMYDNSMTHVIMDKKLDHEKH